MKRWIALLLLLLTAFAAAAIGGLATFESVRTWYPALAKPAWNPPSTLFAPVWTALYIVMSVAAWRVWLRGETPRTPSTLQLYFLSLVLNALWSVLFFGLRHPGWALIDNVLLWLVLIVLQIRFSRIDPVAGWLWAPYLVWVTYALTLNAGICWLN